MRMQKREFQGPECHKVLRKLPELRDYLPEELHTFVDILEEIKEVYKISHAKEVVPNHREVTKHFENTWCSFMTSFGLTMQFVEAAHHKVKAFFEARSNYPTKKNSLLSLEKPLWLG